MSRYLRFYNVLISKQFMVVYFHVVKVTASIVDKNVSKIVDQQIIVMIVGIF